MNTTTDVAVLNHLMALNLEVNIWTARKKLTPADFGGAELPPNDLASLGSKKVCNPQELRIFSTLKARAVSLLNRYGIRFLGGWAIPEDSADEIVSELNTIQDDFLTAKDTFLARYDQAVHDWILQHPGWERLIGSSSVSVEYVRDHLDFNWQLFKLMPPGDGIVHQGLQSEVVQLGGTLFDEIAKAATETWYRCYEGREKVTHKALSPLRAIHAKLQGLTFVEPRVAPVADLLQTTFSKMPQRGYIRGANLVMLQGVIALLRDPTTLVAHGQKILEGAGASDILDGLLEGSDSNVQPELQEENEDSGVPGATPVVPVPHIESHGLW